jgi:hypothetical protein
MARRRITFRRRRTNRLSAYLLGRRVLHNRMHATTPVRFLQTLDFIPGPASFERTPFEFYFDEADADTLRPPLQQDDFDAVPDAVIVDDSSVTEASNSQTSPVMPPPSPPIQPIARDPQRSQPVVRPAAGPPSSFVKPLPRVDARRARDASTRDAVQQPPAIAGERQTAGAIPEAQKAGSHEHYREAPAPLPENVTAGTEAAPPVEMESPGLEVLAESGSIDVLPPDLDVAMPLHDPIMPEVVAPDIIVAPTEAPASEVANVAPDRGMAPPVVSEQHEEAAIPDTVSSAQAAPEPDVETEPVSTSRRKRIEEFVMEKSPSAAVRSEESAGEPRREPAKPAGNAPRVREPAPAPARASDELFKRRNDVDLSPAAWAARLAGSLRPASQKTQATPSAAAHGVLPEAPHRVAAETGQPQRKVDPARASASSLIPAQPPARTPTASSAQASRPSPAKQQPVPTPVNVPPPVRRFLKPLVGIDPDTVPIFQGEQAAAVASIERADAFAIEGAIDIPGRHLAETPRQLGLLAHELTHVVRQRHPRFVPPVARSVRQSFGEAKPEHMDEETLARRVEARVVAEAAGGTQSMWSPGAEPVTPAVEAVQTFETAAAAPPDESDDWGGLPAPWEPLPDWVLALSNESSSAASPYQQAAPAAPAAAIATPPAGAIARAEEGRALQAEVPEAQAAAPGKTDEAKPVAPDLDVLARQVYTILKRRLQAEHRRGLLGQ